MISFQLKHGTTKHTVTLPESSTINDLKRLADELTDIPASGQKLIYNGKALFEPEKTLSEYKIKNGAKIMVLGKKFDPASDALYQSVVDIEGKSISLGRKIEELATEVSEIEDGYLAREHHDQAFKALTKRCKASHEELMRILESLDSLRFEDHQAQAKQKRKSVVTITNKTLDRAEEVLQKIEALQRN